MPTVNHPRLGEINFPDSMTRDEIVAALRKIDADRGVATPAQAPAPVAAQEVPVAPSEFRAGARFDLPQYGYTSPIDTPAMVRMAPAVAAAAFPPTSIPAIAGLAGAGGLSYALADVMERGKADRGTAAEGFKGALTAAIPLPVKPVSGLAGMAGRVTGAGGIAGATEFVSDVGAKFIATGTFPNADEAVQMAKDAAVVAGLVGPLSGIGAFGKGASQVSQEQIKRRALYEQLGSRGNTLAKIEPSFANMERVLSGREGFADVAEKRASTLSEITSAFYDKLGGVASDAQARERLAPFMGLADEAEAAYKAAQQRLVAAEARLAQAQENVGLLPREAAAIREEAAKDMLAAVSERSRADFQAANMLDKLVSDTDAANALSVALKDMHKAVSAQADALYSKLLFPSTEEFIPRDGLEQVAREALGDDAKLPEGKAILSLLSPTEGAPAALSLDAFRSLRKEISGAFAGIPEGKMDNAERLASKVYAKLGDAVGGLINTNPEDKAAYAAAQTFWREISEARHSNLGRELFNIPIRTTDDGASAISGVRAPTISSIAEGIVSGNVDKIKAFKRFTEVLGRYDKNTAALGESTMIKAVRNHLLSKHRENAAGLIDDLVKGASREDVRPYVEALGFGSEQQLKEWRAAVRSTQGNRVTSEMLMESLDNPRVREAISNQFGVKVAASKALAEKVVEQKLLQAQAERALGATEKERKLLIDAQRLAKFAGVEADLARASMNEIANHPIAKVFSGGYMLTDEIARGGARGTISHAIMRMDNDTGKRFMSALERKDPSFAELVRRRVIADEMEQFAKVERVAPKKGTAFDPDAVFRYFNPTLPQERERIERLRAVIGGRATKELESWASNFSIARNQMREAGLTTVDAGEAMAQAAGFGAGTAAGGSGSGIGTSFFTKQAYRFLAPTYYKLNSWLLVDRQASEAIGKTGDVIGYLNSMPIQKAAQIMADRELAAEIQEYMERRKQAQSTAR